MYIIRGFDIVCATTMAPVAPNLVTVLRQGQLVKPKTETGLKPVTARSDEDISQGDSFIQKLRKNCEDEMKDAEGDSDGEAQTS